MRRKKTSSDLELYAVSGTNCVVLSMDMKTINSKTVAPVLEFAHALYFFEKDYFFEHGRYWDWQTVRLIEAGSAWEMIDIDTDEIRKLWERELTALADGTPLKQWTRPRLEARFSGVGA